MWKRLHVQYTLSCRILIKLHFSLQIFGKNLKYQISSKTVQWLPRSSVWTGRQAGRQTDRKTDMTNLIVAFRNFADAPKKVLQKQFVCCVPHTLSLNVIQARKIYPKWYIILNLLGAFAKLRKATIKLCHVCLSVCSYGRPRHPLDGFRWNLIFWLFFLENMSRKFKFH
jgi:hypothetical protein